VDRIEISALRLMTVVGTLPHERETAQPVQVDLALHVDLHDAAATDELTDTVHYGFVADQVADVVRSAKDLLLERLAGRVADECLSFDRVEAVDVTVTKLRPPLGEDVATTAVRLHRAQGARGLRDPHRALVALGSNLGDRAGYLRAAVDALGGVVAQSQVWETAPVGGPDGQGPFLNMVVAVDTLLDPFALLRRCRRIEEANGRQRVVHWGPRTLDVDLLFYDDVTIDSPELVLPHPRWSERRFVLAPLAEVAPERCPAGWDAQLAPLELHPRGPLP
jgi:dihydroneopterin aldolase/2-amino-4-hydroxy-6-hydroxymethyldihydropteridine diphosphokinase